ncbi:TadE/TadG family type IV pilus assembly protein [Trinickia acidisoli]|uniref:TadE/TadG family type IV pilus assembly protein n=1 Tax=Trinickia acidisoli TaxID=2767482 RepID=UPI001A8D6CFD|nr:TadE/TadG family type IV pilus assembly protein [Trinickia acidisoli]
MPIMQIMSTQPIRMHGARFARDSRGTAALEFALVLPVVLAILFGIYEVVQDVRANMQLSNAAVSIADMVAQQSGGVTSGASGSIGYFCRAGELMMTPFPTGATSGVGTFSVAVASVTNYSGSGATVDWESDASCSAAATAIGSAAITLATSPTNLVPNAGRPGDSVIVVQVSYHYRSAIQYLLPIDTVLTKTAFARPRGDEPIACTSPCS